MKNFQNFDLVTNFENSTIIIEEENSISNSKINLLEKKNFDPKKKFFGINISWKGYKKMELENNIIYISIENIIFEKNENYSKINLENFFKGKKNIFDFEKIFNFFEIIKFLNKKKKFIFFFNYHKISIAEQIFIINLLSNEHFIYENTKFFFVIKNLCKIYQKFFFLSSEKKYSKFEIFCKFKIRPKSQGEINVKQIDFENRYVEKFFYVFYNDEILERLYEQVEDFERIQDFIIFQTFID